MTPKDDPRKAEGRGHWNRAARRGGGARPVRLPAAAGILAGVACAGCGAEQIATIPGRDPWCLACGRKAD